MIDVKRKIIFTHPQKCGGTTIEAAFGWHPNTAIVDDPISYTEYFRKLKHASLTEQIELVESLGYESTDFFKFSCIRNPWDMIVSWYFFDKHHGYTAALGSFEEYVLKVFNQTNRLDIKPFLYHDEIYSIDFIIRFENYKEDTQKVFDKFDVNWIEDHNTQIRPQNTFYQEMHTEVTKELVYEKASHQIELFGYEF
jgi:hypothetical protein